MAVIDRLLNDDFMWQPLQSHLRGAHKMSPKHFVNVNCPMCTSRGESADKRRRCGVKHDASGIGIHCFNCGFRARYRLGQRLSKSMRAFLLSIGLGDLDVDRMGHRAFVISTMMQPRKVEGETTTVPYEVVFQRHALPKGSRPLRTWADEGCSEPEFLQVCEYLISRGEAVVDATTYYWCPEPTMRHRLIVPVYHFGERVGWTARTIRQDAQPKYLNSLPEDVMLNTHTVLDPNRTIIVMVEGVFDALALDCLGLLGSKINTRQIVWIAGFPNRRKIVLPDRDKAGQKLVDIALHNHWSVAFPYEWWEPDVKDAAEAVRRYGRLWTLRSIIATATDSAARISMLRKLAT